MKNIEFQWLLLWGFAAMVGAAELKSIPTLGGNFLTEVHQMDPVKLEWNSNGTSCIYESDDFDLQVWIGKNGEVQGVPIIPEALFPGIREKPGYHHWKLNGAEGFSQVDLAIEESGMLGNQKSRNGFAAFTVAGFLVTIKIEDYIPSGTAAKVDKSTMEKLSEVVGEICSGMHMVQE